MPRTESKTTQSRPQLQAVKSIKELEKIEQQVSNIVRRLVNGEDENARDIAVLANLIRSESGVDQEDLLDKITESAFLNTCDFAAAVQSWAREVRGEATQQIRKRA